jgi:serine/threonine protein kinase
MPAAASDLPKPGDRIADKYDVVRVIGEGGMGVVYEVMHARLQQRAAIKMLLSRVQAMPDVVARFEREARAACRLRSRHSVRITDVDHDESGRAYMVMEYLDGHDLAHELHVRGRLSIGESVDFVLQACAAMAEAHTGGVVHRDLKPSNLFLVNEGGERIVKVLDFGISKLAGEGEAHITSTFATMGTPLYMSPEQVRSAKNVDARTDIWSLGVILFEALAGERPFQGTTTAAAAAIVADEPPLLRTVAREAPEGLEKIVSKALAKKPADRYPDVRALAEALSEFAGNRNMLRAIDATMMSPRDGSMRPTGRPSSTPSFVHAETMAQTTPPRHPPTQGLTTADVIITGMPNARPPSTEAAWATQRTTPMRVGRMTGIGIGLMLLAALAGFVITRARTGDSHAQAVPSAATTVPSGMAATATPIATATPNANATATATATANATPTATPNAPATPDTPATLPTHHTHSPSRPPATPPATPHATPSAAPPPTPSPAATNPLHL